MNVGDIILWVSLHWADMLNLGTQAVGVFAIIATLTPNRVDNRIAQVLMDLINFAGCNVKNAANRS